MDRSLAAEGTISRKIFREHSASEWPRTLAISGLYWFADRAAPTVGRVPLLPIVRTLSGCAIAAGCLSRRFRAPNGGSLTLHTVGVTEV